MQSSHAENAIARMKGIALEASVGHRRIGKDTATAKSLARHQAAFDVAVEAFDAEYRRFYQPRAFYDQSDREEMHSDAQLAALEAFLGVYLMEAGL